MTRRRSRRARPLPFENRCTDGEHGWRWHQALEGLGVDTVRLQFALQSITPDSDLAELDIPPRFVRDWLRYHEQRDRRDARRWRLLVVAFAALAAAGAAVSAWPILTR